MHRHTPRPTGSEGSEESADKRTKTVDCDDALSKTLRGGRVSLPVLERKYIRCWTTYNTH